MKKTLLFLTSLLSLNVQGKINNVPVIEKGDSLDISCVSLKNEIILKYDGITQLSEKEEVISFNDKNGMPHVLTKDGICSFTKNGNILK